VAHPPVTDDALGRGLRYGSTPDDVYGSSVKPLIPAVVDGRNASVVILGDFVRYHLLEGDKDNDYFGASAGRRLKPDTLEIRYPRPHTAAPPSLTARGLTAPPPRPAGLVALAARGIGAEIVRCQPSQLDTLMQLENTPRASYTLKLSWAQLDPFHADVISDRLRIFTPEFKSSPLFADPNLMLREGGGGRGMVIPGLIEKEISDVMEVQSILRTLYLTNEREKLSYVHSILTLTVEKYVSRVPDENKYDYVGPLKR
jgi:hypothetical protein